MTQETRQEFSHTSVDLNKTLNLHHKTGDGKRQEETGRDKQVGCGQRDGVNDGSTYLPKVSGCIRKRSLGCNECRIPWVMIRLTSKNSPGLKDISQSQITLFEQKYIHF